MRILISTPLYPPEIGGPSEYAVNLANEFKNLGHDVRVIPFMDVRGWPTGVRHVLLFFKIFRQFVWADWALVLDTFSVALPATVAAKILGKKIIIRTGGDFLWEQYVERTNNLVLFREFYRETRQYWNTKEKVIFRLTRWILRHANIIVFSTDWQRQMWQGPYQLNVANTRIVENYFGGKKESKEASQKIFVGGVRNLRWKNCETLKRAFAKTQSKKPDLILDLENMSYDRFLQKISHAYAVILVSLGDISPNFILDALRFNKPCIMTRETGLYEKLKDVVVFVDPLSEEDIAEKIMWLSDEQHYHSMREKVASFNFEHTWKEIAEEFIHIATS